MTTSRCAAILILVVRLSLWPARPAAGIAAAWERHRSLQHPTDRG